MKVLIIISVILIIVGLAIGFITLASIDFDLKNSEKRISESFTVTEDIASVKIDTGSAGIDVIIRKGTDASAKLDIVRRSVHTVEYSVVDGMLTVSADKKSNFIHNIFNFGGGYAITLTLPEKIYESFDINTKSGDIKISDFTLSGEMKLDSASGDMSLIGINAKSVTASSASGTVEINRLKAAEGITLSAASGDFDLTGIVANSLSIKGASSDVEIEKSTIDFISKIETASGDIDLTDIYTTAEVNIDTTSGEISIENSILGGKLTVESTSADISLFNSDAAELDIKSTSGDVTLELLTPKNIVTDTTSGEVNIHGNIYTSPLCKIKTTSGDITVRVKG